MARGWGRDANPADDDEVEGAAAPTRASPYITPEGYARLKAEYEHLWSGRRPEVVRALSAAAAEGDRSENAEYQYRKKELREIDRRVRYLQRRIPELKVAGSQPAQPQRVYFGARVEVIGPDGESRQYRIVGPDETDAAAGLISVDSPLARALLNHEQGDVVLARLPGGATEFEIQAVRYD